MGKTIILALFLFLLGLLWFWVGRNDLTEVAIKYSRLSKGFLCRSIISQNHGFGYIIGIGLIFFGFGFFHGNNMRWSLNSSAPVHAF